jgi:hypothetical protein
MMNILVWCPGRVGSRSALEAIKKCRGDVCDIHTMEDGYSIDRIKSAMKADGRLRARAREMLAAPTQILIPIREPLGRNLSSWFCPWHTRQYRTKNETNLAVLKERFMREFPHDWITNWFDNELKANIGVDVYTHEFVDGYMRITEGHYDIIIVDYRKINSVLPEKIEKHWGIKLNIGRVKGTSSSLHSKYQEFHKQIKFPRAFAESIYNTKYARHFYGSECDELINKWSADA